MKIGLCTSFQDHDKLRTAKELGFDFMEASFSALANASDEEINAFVELTKQINLPCLSVNCMFPGSLRLTGPDADFNAAEDYLANALEKTKNVGFKRVIFGSGGARQVPEGFSFDKAKEQIIQLCSDVIAPLFQKYGITLGIEELRQQECNILNTCKEVMEIVYAVNKPEVRLLVDYYHMGIENEPIESLVDYKGYITHVHIANPKNGRMYPQTGDGEDYQKFFDILRQAEYENKLVSLEGKDGGNFVEVSKDALKLLKSL